MIKLDRRPWPLAIAAWILALVFAAGLLLTGLGKYQQVMQGGENFHDFSGTSLGIWRTILTVAYGGLIGLYSLFLWDGQTGKQWLPQLPPQYLPKGFADLLKLASPFLGLAFLAYPYSSDAYLYLHYGTMASHGMNPYLHTAAEFSSSLSRFIHWTQTATYGPVSMGIFLVPSWFLSISPIAAIFALKGFCLFAHGLNAYLIWRLIGIWLPGGNHQFTLTALYLLNPILLNEFVSNIHLDVFLTTTVIALISCLYSRRYVMAILALWAGCLTKTLPVLWLPLVVGYLVRRRQWRSLILAAGLSLVLIVMLSLTVFPSLAAWKSLVNPGVAGLTARSLYHGLNIILEYLVGVPLSDRLALLSSLNRIAYGGFLVFYAWVGLKPFLNRTYNEANLVVDLGWIALVLFLCATPWLMPWYPTVLVAIALLSFNAPGFFWVSMVFCLSPGLVVGAGSGGGPGSLLTVAATVGPAIGLLISRWRPRSLTPVTEPVPERLP